MRRRAVLALTPDLSRSDANRILLSLLDELGRAGAVDPTRTRVVAGRDGPLSLDIRDGADLATPRIVGGGADRLGAVAARVHPRARPAGERIGLSWGLVRRPVRAVFGPPDVVWAHGAAALSLAEALPRPARQAPLVVRLPEGPVGLARAAGADAGERLGRARLVVVACAAMRDHLVGDLGLPAGRVVVHPPWILPPAPGDVTRPAIPDYAVVVAGGGPIGWRAGTDLFVDLAAHLPDEVDGHPVHLVWVGRPDGPEAAERVATDIVLRGLAGRVHLVEADGWAATWPPPALVVVTAREAPVPLLALDAARRSVPVIGHRTSGLADVVPAAVHDEALVDLFAAAALAERATALLADPVTRASLGAEQGVHVTRHHDARTRVADLWSDVAAHLARG